MKNPKNWEELQSLTCQLFTELGCTCEIEKSIDVLRGSKEIDVYIEDKISNPSLIYLCECKNWNGKVPKGTVHEFRSIVTDSGANRGFIISKSGFQKGSYEAAKNTNIELVTWEELQKLFESRWFDTIQKNVLKLAQQITVEHENFFKKKGDWEQLSKITQNDYLELISKFSCFVSLGVDVQLSNKFPKKVTNAYGSHANSMISIKSIRDYHDYIFSLGNNIIDGFVTI
jgi:hypothetical protein